MLCCLSKGTTKTLLSKDSQEEKLEICPFSSSELQLVSVVFQLQCGRGKAAPESHKHCSETDWLLSSITYFIAAHVVWTMNQGFSVLMVTPRCWRMTLGTRLASWLSSSYSLQVNLQNGSCWMVRSPSSISRGELSHPPLYDELKLSLLPLHRQFSTKEQKQAVQDTASTQEQ